jgi:hypothetical protein
MPRKWYSATLIWEALHDNVGATRPLCEEQIVLFKSDHVEGAKQLAVEYGTAYEHEYPNVYREMVRWRFVGIDKLEELDEPTGDGLGWEVASRFVNRRRQTLERVTIPAPGLDENRREARVK